MERLIRKEVFIPDSLITRNDSLIPWEHLILLVESSDLTRKKEVMEILSERKHSEDHLHPYLNMDSCIAKLKQLDNGDVWQEINRLFFKNMRNVCAVLVSYKQELTPIRQTAEESSMLADTPAAEPESASEIERMSPEIEEGKTTTQEVREWTRKLYLKSNAIGLGMGIANIAAEIDLAPHWSFTFPLYFSA